MGALDRFLGHVGSKLHLGTVVGRKNDLAAPKPAQRSILGAQLEKLLLVVGSIKHEFSAAWDEVVSLLLKYGS
jgi:hypothetical protein